MENNYEKYQELAQRNSWDFSMNNNRPYFMKNGKYVIPDEATSEEDKQLLAYIISEGSIEMQQLIIMCWDNKIDISGPCSGIKAFHDTDPLSLHFSFIGPKDLIEELYQNVKAIFPNFDHLLRNNNEKYRYDIGYFLKGKELSQEEADQIFAKISEQLTNILNKQNNINYNYI